jgi:hypothetical protein
VKSWQLGWSGKASTVKRWLYPLGRFAAGVVAAGVAAGHTSTSRVHQTRKARSAPTDRAQKFGTARDATPDHFFKGLADAGDSDISFPIQHRFAPDAAPKGQCAASSHCGSAEDRAVPCRLPDTGLARYMRLGFPAQPGADEHGAAKMGCAEAYLLTGQKRIE